MHCGGIVGQCTVGALLGNVLWGSYNDVRQNVAQCEAVGCYGEIDYGVASVSRIDKITRVFCKRALQKRLYSAKETYNLIDPTHRSHPIWGQYGAVWQCGAMYRDVATMMCGTVWCSVARWSMVWQCTAGALLGNIL